jgi:hypothetical protein
MRSASPSEATLPGLLPLHAQGIHGRAELVESKRAESLSHGSLQAWRVAMDAAEASERNTVYTETLNPSPSRVQRTLPSRCVQSLSSGSLKAWRVAMDAAEASQSNTVHTETLNPSSMEPRIKADMYAVASPAPLLRDSGRLCELAAKAQLHQERHERKGSSRSVGAQHLHLEVLANLQVTLAARDQVITSKDAEIEHLKSRHQDVLAGVYVCVTHTHTHTHTHTDAVTHTHT